MELFLEKLNDFKILAADISFSYLMADTEEMIYTKLGPEFGYWASLTAIVKKVLYRLIGSCARFHKHLCKELFRIGFKPSKSYPY